MKIKVSSKEWLTSFFQSLRSSLKESIAVDEESFTFFKKYVCANIEYGIPDNVDPKTYSEIVETEERLEEMAVDLAFKRRQFPQEFQELFKDFSGSLINSINKLIEENDSIGMYQHKDSVVDNSINKSISLSLSKLEVNIDVILKRLKKCKRVFDDELRKSLGTYGYENEDNVVKYFDEL
ncbi:hypothetical protein H312_00286 [Anncaliia algerae PRA339]|uniref:Uncharacterized protein n=1 Tax=Anncaliia algerae PRA339 TaxID=1288291 RepID=A0A059F4P6_9MICR|nr:hypothetical protein H312_00286 [Anncaliia algerae PRA339]